MHILKLTKMINHLNNERRVHHTIHSVSSRNITPPTASPSIAPRLSVSVTPASIAMIPKPSSSRDAMWIRANSITPIERNTANERKDARWFGLLKKPPMRPGVNEREKPGTRWKSQRPLKFSQPAVKFPATSTSSTQTIPRYKTRLKSAAGAPGGVVV